MLFNSLQFIIFFPVVSIIYFLIPHKARWIWLLVTSYFFYMSWNPEYGLLIATSTVLTYLSGILINKSNAIPQEKKRMLRKKLWVALSFASNLLILVFFKYFYFLFDNIKAVLALANITITQPSFDILLPVGISFYTFQALGYTMDVYRGNVPAEKNVLKYALFVSFFPQLVAGPIERSGNLLSQINERHYFEYDRVKNGLVIMLWGYLMKMVIADRAAIFVNAVFDNYAIYPGAPLALAVLLFAVQIYCDFAGYSYIAIGAAQVMGFRLMDNFRQPYFAQSIQEFWRRWHISLSTWFRDYLYIPLGGGRVSKWKRYCNIMITFLVSGLWHGASWNYVIWGGLHGAFQIVGDATKNVKSRCYNRLSIRTDVFSFRLLKGLITFLLTNFAWIFFRAKSGAEALSVLRALFLRPNIATLLDGTLFSQIGLGQIELWIIICSIVLLLIVDVLQSRMNILERLDKQNLWFRWIVYYGLIALIFFFGVHGSDYAQTQFIYFQF